MELRGMTVFLALFLIAASQCSEARSHSIQRRSTNAKPVDDFYDDLQNDAAVDDDTQNDAAADDDTQNDDGGDDETEDVDAEILNKGEEFHVNLGSSVRLPCIIEPSPASNQGVVYQWMKDANIYFIGTLKLAAPDRMSVDKNQSSLLIEDIKPEDNGKYKCMIMKERTHANEKPDYVEHIVRVESTPRVIDMTASDRGMVREGADVQITCNATGSPPPKLIWMKETASGDSEPLTEHGVEFAPNSLIIRNIRRQQAGKYLCLADNKIGTPGFGSINIKVLSKPHVKVDNTVVNSDLNMEATLECSAHEHPPAHIRWYKDGLLLEDIAKHFSVETVEQHSVLKVIPDDESDFGVYTCEAENELGKHNKSIELVQTPVIEDIRTNGPMLTYKVKSHQPLLEMNVELQEINGNGKKILTIPLPEQRRHLYEITYILDDKDLKPGKYQALVAAKNIVDWGKPTQTVPVEIDSQSLIKTASVLNSGSNAPTALATTSLLATISMYLFFRML